MGSYVLRRMVTSIPVVLGVASIIFFVMRIIPGDPAEIIIGATPGATDEQIDQLRSQLGTDRPLLTQYWSFVTDAVMLDLGNSYQSGADGVTSMISEQLPSTLQLTVAAALVGSLAGVALGVVAAANRNSFVDRLCMLFAVAGVSVPGFWLGIVLILLFGVELGWLPVTSNNAPSSFAEVLDPSTFPSLVLPALTLGIALAAGTARLVRSSMVEALWQDYIRTARAKGLANRDVINRHALRNSLIPSLTLLGIQVGAILGGAVIIETVFARPGLGRLLVGAIGQKDIPVVQGVILFIAVAHILLNLVIDVSYGLLDPRVRVRA